MKTLDEITKAARSNAPLDIEDARLAIAAHDVLLASLDVSREPEWVAKYFEANSMPAADFIGFNNSPYNSDFVAWYRGKYQDKRPPAWRPN